MEEQNSLKQHVVKYGLILSMVSIAITMILYLINYELLAKGWVGLIILAVILGLLIIVGNKYRESIGGFMSFKEGFKLTFLTLAISILIGTLFNIVLYHVIDTELGSKLDEVIMTNTAEMMEKFGAPESSIDETLQNLSENSNFTIKKQLFSMLWSLLIGGGIISLIVGAIIKRKNPELIA
ncbi:MAG: uncharacterized membrane protein (DUF106 family) [Sphingobacteriales bacterium]|jgi:uncharacterized membrane protein (DUF106 family)